MHLLGNDLVTPMDYASSKYLQRSTHEEAEHRCRQELRICAEGTPNLQSKANDYTLRPLLIQLVQSATSIGANVHEGIAAESRADVRHNMAIAYKEANECVFWLNILHDASCITPDVYEQCYPLGVELTKILGSINKTLKEKAS